jgi:hypothetical protein
LPRTAASCQDETLRPLVRLREYQHPVIVGVVDEDAAIAARRYSLHTIEAFRAGRALRALAVVVLDTGCEAAELPVHATASSISRRPPRACSACPG